jgi:hypothetical protein
MIKLTSKVPQQYNQHPHYKPLSEGLEYKDMVGILKSTMHIDEFSSKMGDDDDIIVVSFYVRSKEAASDLTSWFEKGYDWVLDADVSPGEIKPGRFLVYIELRRRSSAGKNLALAVDDLASLTEHTPSDWVMVYKDKETPFSQEEFDRLVPLSPKQYRKEIDGDLNEMRAAAGIDVKQIYERDKDIRQLQAAAGQV